MIGALYVFLIPLASQRLPFTSPVSEFGEWVEKERVGKKIETESDLVYQRTGLEGGVRATGRKMYGAVVM